MTKVTPLCWIEMGRESVVRVKREITRIRRCLEKEIEYGRQKRRKESVKAYLPYHPPSHQNRALTFALPSPLKPQIYYALSLKFRVEFAFAE